MIEELRAELAELSARLERGKKIDAMLRSLQSEERELAGREQGLKAELAKEESDVQRLERTTATSLLYSLLNRRQRSWSGSSRKRLPPSSIRRGRAPTGRLPGA